jgi:hypothetical protein
MTFGKPYSKMEKGTGEEGIKEKLHFMMKEKVKFRLVLSSLLLSCILLLSAGPKHEYHVSVTQMQHNPATRSFEISIRIFTDDLERGLAADNPDKRFVVKNNDQNDPVIAQYIRKHFLLTDHLKKASVIRYIGKEQEEDATWVYLEIPFQGAMNGYKLQNSILMETFDDQVNMTNVRYSSEKKTFLFKKGQLVHSL